MAVLIDEPIWPAHGTLWAHLVSDESYRELHAFAGRAGIPERGFDHDHYDVPLQRWQKLVDLGAQPVTGRELLRRLQRAGLRVRQKDKRGF
jgi:predicted kinase